ncbi:hypothetical protein LUZ61_011409 [Rhynchospora tenuis]|uniref:Malectin-like domain-containing protein n=1 Tax=Rhynchospora tenuis TaxID=198213 RepID=A0AAD6A0Y3_9POAL|nr:hypothetical protein LUZ61_011409 [Rhynchospora tenuis]
MSALGCATHCALCIGLRPVNGVRLPLCHHVPPKMKRYPDDKYDRWWSTNDTSWLTYISTSSAVTPDQEFETPSLVMQTAAATLSTKQPLFLNWTSIHSTEFVILHFAEIQDNILKTDRRDITLEATSNSTLPPLLNAIELYGSAPVPAGPTYAPDGITAINSIKDDYDIRLGWVADPCLPYPWLGITHCSKDSNNNTRIMQIDLSGCGLRGPLSDHFAHLTALKYL